MNLASRRRPGVRRGAFALPLIRSDAAATVLVTNDDIANALDADDIERYSGQ